MSFNCLPNCGECCGVVPIPFETWEKHKHKVKRVIDDYNLLTTNEVLPVTTDNKCPFIDNYMCMIYEDRPEVCRLFGTDKMPCPYLKPNGNARSAASKKQVMRKIQRSYEDAKRSYRRTSADNKQ